jgi:outer membrane protein assembly factor BamA
MHQKTNRWRVPCLVALGALLPDSLRAQSASEAFPEPDSFADQLRGTESQDPTIGQRNHAISSCTLSGGNRTPPSTVCDLLPRPPPSLYSAEELAEFERRLANLAIFDAVHVQERNGQLQVVARERWTLIPIFEIATGGSLENTFVLFGLTEYNTLGSANETAIVASYERRGINFAASYSPHVFRSSAWTPAFTIFRESFEVGFAGNDPNAWRATDSGVDLTLRPPNRTRASCGLQTAWEPASRCYRRSTVTVRTTSFRAAIAAACACARGCSLALSAGETACRSSA